MTKTNAGSPKGRESYGDGVPIVVAGVTTCQGRRESRLQGEGEQVTGHRETERYAKCRTPRLCWVSSVNAAGRDCRWMSCTGSCSTRSCICWQRADLLQPRGDDARGHAG